MTGHTREIDVHEARLTQAGQALPVPALCRSGNRSDKAAAALAAAGVDVRNVTGGMQAWAAAGLPVFTGQDRPGAVA